MKVATWNVNGIRARQAEVSAFIERERPDVLCLQEIKATPAQVPAELCEHPGYWCYWHGERAYSGIGLHVSRTAFAERPAFSHPVFDNECRVAAVELPGVTVVSIYVPNGGKDYPAKLRFLEAMIAYAAEVRSAGRNLLMCGDMNVARTDMDVHPKERKPTAIGQLLEERVLFERLLETGGLIDVARMLHPTDENLFTWWAPWRNLRQRNIGWRIDYMLASEALARSARSFTSQREVGTSDHAPLITELGV